MKELQILGLDEYASFDDIKKKYRELAKRYHPDINPSGEEKFKIIDTAYQYLLTNHTQKSKPIISGDHDLRYQFWDNKRKKWLSNVYFDCVSEFPDIDGNYIVKLPPESFDYNGKVILKDGSNLYFNKGQKDGSIAKIRNKSYKIVYTKKYY